MHATSRVQGLSMEILEVYGPVTNAQSLIPRMNEMEKLDLKNVIKGQIYGEGVGGGQ